MPKLDLTSDEVPPNVDQLVLAARYAAGSGADFDLVDKILDEAERLTEAKSERS